MKLNIEECADCPQTEITVRCARMDGSVKRLIEQIRLYGAQLEGHKDGQTVLLSPCEIYYIESVEERTYLYAAEQVYESDLRLYELEQRLCDGPFLRISKACIMNLTQLKGFQSRLNGKLEAELRSGERLEVTRHYVAALKQRLREMKGAGK